MGLILNNMRGAPRKASRRAATSLTLRLKFFDVQDDVVEKNEGGCVSPGASVEKVGVRVESGAQVVVVGAAESEPSSP